MMRLHVLVLLGVLSAWTAHADVEMMTLCLNCTRSDECAGDSDPQVFTVPVGECFNPLATWPDSGDVWGEFDILDECGELALTRTFFASTNGSCAGAPTDSYTLPYDTCLGPFGAPRPWGVFTCAGEEAAKREREAVVAEEFERHLERYSIALAPADRARRLAAFSLNHARIAAHNEVHASQAKRCVCSSVDVMTINRVATLCVHRSLH